MRAESLQAFRDEVTKIAFAGKVFNHMKDMVDEGWNGPEGNRFNWTGEGRNIYQGMKPGKIMNRALGAFGSNVPGQYARGMENLKSLGGLTKVLPFGAKGMTFMGAAMSLPHALRAQDPSGLQRSRTERVAGMAGNMLGGMVGAGTLGRTGAGRALGGLGSSMVGGMAGGMIGEKLLTSPFALGRKVFGAKTPAQRPMQQPVQQPAQQPVPSGVPQ